MECHCFCHLAGSMRTYHVAPCCCIHQYKHDCPDVYCDRYIDSVKWCVQCQEKLENCCCLIMLGKPPVPGTWLDIAEAYHKSRRTRDSLYGRTEWDFGLSDDIET